MIASGTRVAILGCFLLFPCLANEAVTLNTGFRLEAVSHTQSGDRYTFHLAAGTIQVQASQIATIEQIPDSPISAPGETVKGAMAISPEQVLVNAGLEQGLPPEFVLSVAKVESALHQEAVSPKGAYGLMQLMPETASSLGVDAAKADENAKGGAMYLRALLLRYHNDAVLALAAYNAGPGAVAKFGGVPPYPETQRYIQRVLAEYSRQGKRRPRLPEPAGSTTGSSNKPSATN
jgi:soluble lytic murein transglycosylase-like protein